MVRGVGLRFGHNLRDLNRAKVTLGEASHKWLRQNAREGENSDAATQKALQVPVEVSLQVQKGFENEI